MKTYVKILSLLPGIFFLFYALPRLTSDAAYNLGMMLAGLFWFLPAYFAFRKNKKKEDK